MMSGYKYPETGGRGGGKEEAGAGEAGGEGMLVDDNIDLTPEPEIQTVAGEGLTKTKATRAS